MFRAWLAEYGITQDRNLLRQCGGTIFGRPSNFGKGRDVCNVEEMLNVYAITGDQDLLTKARAKLTRISICRSLPAASRGSVTTK